MLQDVIERLQRIEYQQLKIQEALNEVLATQQTILVEVRSSSKELLDRVDALQRSHDSQYFQDFRNAADKPFMVEEGVQNAVADLR